ncbi:hypothetical protein BGZ94_008019 [Podila epigama]|nr:hypothetical protein BGZ94_008019 [Podila epigama]
MDTEQGTNVTPRDDTTATHADSYPEGGFGWFALAATTVVSFWQVCLGVAMTWGVFIQYFLQEETFPGAIPSNLGWVGSIGCSVIFAAAPFVSLANRILGIRPVLVSGVLASTLGMILGSFASQVWHLYLTMGLLSGLGSSILYSTSLTILSEYFFKKRGLVIGIATSGGGIGSCVMAVLIRWMLAKLGFPWTTRILGGCMALMLGLAVVVLRPLRHPALDVSAMAQGHFSESPSVVDISNARSKKSSMEAHLCADSLQSVSTTTPPMATSNNSHHHPTAREPLSEESSLRPTSTVSYSGEPEPNSEPESNSELEPSPELGPNPELEPARGAGTDVGPRRPRVTPEARTGGLDFSLFRQVDFALIILATSIFTLVFLVPLFLMPSYITSIGGTAAQGAMAVSICSAVSVLSRVVLGLVADRVGVLNTTIACTLLTSINVLLIWGVFAKSIQGVIVFMVFYGFSSSTIILLPLAASKAVSADKLSSSVGFAFFAHTTGYLLGTPAAQSIVHHQGGSYSGAIVFVGVANLLCALVVLAARCTINRRQFWIIL